LLTCYLSFATNYLSVDRVNSTREANHVMLRYYVGLQTHGSLIAIAGSY